MNTTLKIHNPKNLLWKPELYHGINKNNNFFEGWYYKIISEDEKSGFAIIPGVFLNKDKNKNHAFIQFYDGKNFSYNFFKYDISEFIVKDVNKFEIIIGDSFFSDSKIELNINKDNKKIFSDISIVGKTPWEIKTFSPGVMGWFAFLPQMECYYGVVSLLHKLSGRICVNDQKYSFNDGKGYIEKNWGKSFPSSWVWIQSNHFDNPEVSFVLSVAKIPYLGMRFNGFTGGLLVGKMFYEFATFNGAKIVSLNKVNNKIFIKIKKGSYFLVVEAKKIGGLDLPCPTLDGMTGKINESLNSQVKILLYKKVRDKNEIIFQGTGRNCGLEISNNVQELFA